MEGYWNVQTLGSSFFCNSFQHWNDIIAWMRTYETRYNLSFSKNNAGDKREGGVGEGEGGRRREEEFPKESFQKDARRRRMFSFLFSRAIIVPWGFLGCLMSLDVDPFCPGAVSAMDKLMMRGAHHRQLDIRLRQRDAMLYTIQVRDKRKDLRARRIGTSRGGLTRGFARVQASCCDESNRTARKVVPRSCEFWEQIGSKRDEMRYRPIGSTIED